MAILYVLFQISNRVGSTWGEIIDIYLTCGKPMMTSCLFTPGDPRDRVTTLGISTQKQEVNTMRRGGVNGDYLGDI